MSNKGDKEDANPEDAVENWWDDVLILLPDD
jgi:hypothetical protein